MNKSTNQSIQPAGHVTGMISSELVRLAITLIACISVFIGGARAQQSSPKPNWRVKYQSGPLHVEPGTWLSVAFLTTTEQTGYAATALITLPLARITGVEFDAKTEKKSDLLQGMQRSGCAYARSKMPQAAAPSKPAALIVAPASPGPISRLAEKLNQKHPIRIVWSDGEAGGAMVVRFNDCEYASFLANLRQSLGARWQRVARELP